MLIYSIWLISWEIYSVRFISVCSGSGRWELLTENYCYSTDLFLDEFVVFLVLTRFLDLERSGRFRVYLYISSRLYNLSLNSSSFLSAIYFIRSLFSAWALHIRLVLSKSYSKRLIERALPLLFYKRVAYRANHFLGYTCILNIEGLAIS